MANLLRKAKSTIYAHGQNNGHNKDIPPAVPPKESSTGLLQQISTLKNRRKSRIDLSTAVESQASVEARQQREQELRSQRSISQLRRRLVRKASTFNLHTRSRTATSQKDLEEHHRSEHLFPDDEAYDKHPQTQADAQRQDSRPATASTGTAVTVYSDAAETAFHRTRTNSADSESAYSQVTTVPARGHNLPVSCDTDKPLPTPLPLSPFDNPSVKAYSNQKPIDNLILQAQQEILQAQVELGVKYPSYQERHTATSIGGLGLCQWSKMAAPGAEPPLPYEKLKTITHEACETALSTATSYDHSQTEQWNTTIINTILSQLVGETSSQTSTTTSTSTNPSPANANGTTPAQPKYKFVVNSTIIQHRSGPVDDKSTTGQGRRGMHSAAGAYWNNERDGMWSYKYEAAESKGLNIVVGVVWVWVG